MQDFKYLHSFRAKTFCLKPEKAMKNLLTLLVISTMLLVHCGKEEENNTENSDEFTLTSSAIEDGKLLSNYKCEQKVNDTENSIPLSWSNVPEGTGALAIVMYHYPDPTKQDDNPNTYLFLWDIDPSVTEIPYGTADDGPWFMGPNKDKTAISYTSPCSHSTGTHVYTLKIYALSETPASLPTESTLDMSFSTFNTAMASVTILGVAELSFKDVTE